MSLHDPVDLTEALVAIPSVNPELATSRGENDVADYVASHLQSIGAVVEEQEVVRGRSNVLGAVAGGKPYTLVLEAHLDTVPLPESPMPVGISGNLLWGRGSCDTKASLAAMLCAIEQVAREPERYPTVIFAGAVDEEFVMKGAQALATRLQGVDGIIIGEPTDLHTVRAHNGCVRFRIAVKGRTAHTSRALLGRNAIVDASRLVTTLADGLCLELAGRQHPLTGQGLLSATIVEGGIAPNVVPDSCVVTFDRRLVPGETVESALAEVDAVLEGVRETHGIDAQRSESWLELPPVEVDDDSPLVRVGLSAELHGGASSAHARGVPYCTDANVLTGGAGIPSIVLGPGSIDQAHAPEEWVDIRQIRQAVDSYLFMLENFGEG